MCVTHIAKVAKSCTFHVHTMKHQVAMDSKPFQVEICSKPSQIIVDKIMTKVLEELKLPNEAKKYFSIWLTSPQLRTYIYNTSLAIPCRCIVRWTSKSYLNDELKINED